MSVEELVNVPPEGIIDLLLTRRRLLQDQLPYMIQGLEETRDQMQIAYDTLKPKYLKKMDEINRFRMERDEAHSEAKELRNKVEKLQDDLARNGQMKSLDPRWKKDKLLSELDSIDDRIQTSALDHVEERKLLEERRKLIRRNDDWLEERKQANPELAEYVQARRDMSRLYQSGNRAHQDMIQTLEKSASSRKKFNQTRKDLRDAKTQLEAAGRLMEESEQAITYWARRKENGIGEIEPDPMLKNPKFYIHNLGEKAQRIREGNTSAAGRRRKKRNRKKTTEVEEE
ncbi:MAG: hypothetical protein ACJZ59_02910 [Candidatus Thalassarchaeaceae archaeon]|nr:MAG: hypothetical protein CBE15_07015 [Euryarchaeota archaeon TMED255]|tara:strand:- start:9066 stop:9923 length:858 start_codon:yes stop_codon:yes gene_type:complete